MNYKHFVALFAAAVLTLVTQAAYAGDDFIVYSPYVTKGQAEVEIRGFTYQGGGNLAGTSASEMSVAYGVTSWWKPELYVVKYSMDPDGTVRSAGYEFENTFQLAPAGEYWADPGFLLSYEFNTPENPGGGIVEFGPLFEKRSGRFDQKFNLIWEKQVGANDGEAFHFRSSYSMIYKLTKGFAPGFEAYYRPDDSAYQIGPIVFGEFYAGKGSEIEYRVGAVFGINPDAPKITFLAILAYEFF